MATAYPYYLAGRAVMANQSLTVCDKFTGKAAFTCAKADRATVVHAIEAAANAFASMRNLPAYQRQKVLHHVGTRLHEDREDFAEVICVEAGKPIRDSRGEVERAIDTFRIAAEEAVRIAGDLLPLDISKRTEGLRGVAKRMPIGPCSFITPFNFPLNLVAHKIAPAIAMGCSFVLKPAPTTPISALLLGEILAETDLPPGSFSILPCDVEDAAPLIDDERIKLLSFTGSAAVGWELKSKAGKKKVLLELGGNAACIVDRDANLDEVTKRIIFGGFYQSGQSCISVQRVLIHESIYDQLKRRIVDAARVLKWGNPREEATILGPLISEKDVGRISGWINEAVEGGARVLCGGKGHDRVFFDATVVENTPRRSKLNREEVFGPVITLEPFATFEQACEIVNQSRYGLQAGVFTGNLKHALFAFDTLEVGGVIINDVPSLRVDNMPYGGIKDSGMGREGVRYAMEEMSEIRLMVIRG